IVRHHGYLQFALHYRLVKFLGVSEADGSTHTIVAEIAQFLPFNGFIFAALKKYRAILNDRFTQKHRVAALAIIKPVGCCIVSSALRGFKSSFPGQINEFSFYTDDGK